MCDNLRLYAVRNQEGDWFRAKGYSHSYGKTWVKDVNSAKFYALLGQARARVTYFANTYPQYGVPEIIEFTFSNMKVLDESNRVEKVQLQKQKALAKRSIASALYKKAQLEETIKQSQKELHKMDIKQAKLN